MREIIHQQQPTSKNCVCTCLAMLLEKPADEVISEFHDDYIKGINVDIYLSNYGILARAMLTTVRGWSDGKLYLIAVPSLNTESFMHQIICDCRDPKNFKVFDPNQGRIDKKYYVWKHPNELQELEVNLESYVFDYEIVNL